MAILGQLARRAGQALKRAALGQSPQERAGSRLRVIADRIPNLITTNGKVVSTAWVEGVLLFLNEQLNWDLGRWEPWIMLGIGLYTLWRTPNYTSPQET